MREDRECLLSISLLMCGRADTQRCLESLVPFTSQLPCEIIVVDTGCDEKTREVIERYTDHIIPFTWCNDFSKARNAGLQEARGEWFLYLDDDEWFEDPSEIIEFFTSKEYINYRSACYMQRNYHDYEETSYSDAAVSRMIKLEKNTCFKSSIHEYLWEIKAPVKLFDTYVKHFGYIFSSKKEQYEHSRRNVDLLIEMMKKEPMEFRWDTHILQEYWGIGEMSKLIEIAGNGIAKYHRNKEHDMGERRSLGTFYGYLAEGYGRKFDYEREKKAIEDGLRERDLTRLAKAFLYKAAIYLNYAKERYESCVDAYEHYRNTYDRIGDKKKELFDQGGLLIGDTFQKETVEDAVLHGIMAAARIGRDDIVERDFYMLGWKEKRMLLHPDFQEIVIRRMVETPCRESYVAMAKTMAERDNNISGVVKILQKLEASITEESWRNLIELFSKVESNHWYITYLKLLRASEKNQSEEIGGLFDNLCLHVFDIFNLDKKLWSIAETYQISMEPFFLRIDLDTWRDGIVRWIMNTDAADLDYKEGLVRQWKHREDIRYDFFFMKIKEGRLLQLKEEEYEFETFEELIAEFACAEQEFYAEFYKKKTFTSYCELLPHECRVAVGLAKVIRIRRETNSREVLDMVKPLIDVYPPLNQTIRTYITKFGAYLKSQEHLAQSEMEQLAVKLKSNACDLIRQGRTREARDILKQLLQYFPADQELEELMEQTLSNS